MAKLRAFFIIVALASVLFGVGFDVYAVYGQSAVNTELLQERLNSVVAHQARVDDETASFRDQARALDMAFERRLTILETLAESNTYLMRGISLAIACMLAKELFLWRKKGSDD